MHLIAYISDYNDAPEAENTVIGDIVRTAKRENPKYNITGVLFFNNGKFLQAIEGNEHDLRQLMQNIEKDSRHKNVEYLIDSPVLARGFQAWNMDSFNLDGTQIFDRDILKKLTQSFKETLLPRSDALILYYKALLGQKAA